MGLSLKEEARQPSIMPCLSLIVESFRVAIFKEFFFECFAVDKAVQADDRFNTLRRKSHHSFCSNECLSV